MEKCYSKDGQFDYATWTNDISVWEKNKEALGFKVKIRIESGKLQMNVDSENKYKKAITSLAMRVLNGAMQWACIAYNFQVKEEHKESERERFQKEWSEKIELLLNTFLESGVGPFFDLLDSCKMIYRMKYELENLTYVDGKWIRWNGDVWTGKDWENEKGERYSDILNPVFSTLLTAEETEVKKIA